MANTVLPAAVLALAFGFGGALLIYDVVELTHDRLLDGSVLAVAERLTTDENGAVTLDLPEAALAMLESDAQDRVYYSVTYAGTLVTGYPDLGPPPPETVAEGRTSHRDGRIRGAAVRIAALARRIYGKPEPVIVQVAETRNGRTALERRLLGSLAILESGLLGVTGLLAWYGVGRGLAPMDRLRDEIDRRAVPGAINLNPLETATVPREVLAPVLAFNALLDRLGQSMSAARRFTADASHQLRTPLAVLRTHLELLRRVDPASPEGQAALEDIAAATHRLERLLAQLLALARADEAGAGAPPVELDLAQVAANAVAAQAPPALAKGMEVQFARPDGAVPILGDALLVGEIIANLLDNALRYNRASGTVSVRVVRDERGSGVEIEDEGPGIPREHRARVFERFYRIPRRGSPEGSGLGLAIARAIADSFGAAITLSDRPDGPGLKATVMFPAVPPENVR